MDSGCSKHIILKIENLFLLKSLTCGGVCFCNGKKGYIIGVGKIKKLFEHSIDNVYYISGLKYSLLCV